MSTKHLKRFLELAGAPISEEPTRAKYVREAIDHFTTGINKLNTLPALNKQEKELREAFVSAIAKLKTFLSEGCGCSESEEEMEFDVDVSDKSDPDTGYSDFEPNMDSTEDECECTCDSDDNDDDFSDELSSESDFDVDENSTDKEFGNEERDDVELDGEYSDDDREFDIREAAEKVSTWDDVKKNLVSDDNGDKVDVPANVLSSLNAKIKELEKNAKHNENRDTDRFTFYTKGVTTLKTLHDHLSTKTMEGLKQAQAYLPGLQGEYFRFVPEDVQKFITGGGKPANLKSIFDEIKMKKTKSQTPTDQGAVKGGHVNPEKIINHARKNK